MGFIFFGQGFGKLGSGFLARFISLAKVTVCKVIFSASVLASLALVLCTSAVLVFAKSSLPKIKLCVKVNQVAVVLVFNWRVLQNRVCPTKRAPDAGDSAAFSSIFLRLIIFPVGRRSAARPSAGNANR